ncbi:MAG: N-acetyltransferase family protein [Acidobacteria bacterium]|nr:MAG: N-acetyltransferase family protein [Acidobacteriota bacterium]
MTRADWNAVRSIYQEGIETQLATFETEAPAWEDWDRSHRADCRLVARDDGRVLGWAALSPVSERCIYGGVAEVSVYLAEAARGVGLGKALLSELAGRSETAGIWTLQAGLFPENQASVALHRLCGFREVGIRRHLGKSGGQWRDVLLMERRSQVVGVD